MAEEEKISGKVPFITSWCIIRDQRIIMNGQAEATTENFLSFVDFFKNLYKKEKLGYPKFYKMDDLSKLGFLTTEILIKNTNRAMQYGKDRIAVVISNSSSSLDTDIHYFETIKDKNNFFPSPSVFVYTLPNILIGEICIKNKIIGENAFLVSEKFDGKQLYDCVSGIFSENKADECICGWVELLGDTYGSFVMIVEKELHQHAEKQDTVNELEFSPANIEQLFLNQG